MDEDPEAFSEIVALGVMRIPVTTVGDQVVVGYDEKKLREALAAADGR